MNHKPARQRAHIAKADLILAAIRMCHAEEDQDPSYLDMMTDVIVSTRTIAEALRHLQAFGNLHIDRSAGRRNRYIIQENK